MRAILSDVHGNLEALRAVLEDARGQGASEVYCLGDVIGYGPDPGACLDLAMGFRVALLGNHDQAALTAPEGFNPAAERSSAWTRGVLHEPSGARGRRLEFLARLPRRHSDGGLLFVHGSARNPVNEYVFPEDVCNPRKMARVFALVERVCFQGHTHLPGVFTESLDFLGPRELGGAYRLGRGKALVNVGSVGQPRDGDPRASYALLEGDVVRFRRVDYDVGATARKLLGVPEVGGALARRLQAGR